MEFSQHVEQEWYTIEGHQFHRNANWVHIAYAFFKTITTHEWPHMQIGSHNFFFAHDCLAITKIEGSNAIAKAIATYGMPV
jgi:hypothetical protein